MRDLVRLAGDKEVTFHRAFDHAQDLDQALEQIIDVGCRRLLTSGGRPTVPEGLKTIADLARRAGQRLRIAAGGGVTPAVASELRRIANVDLHVSLRRTTRPGDPLWNRDNETADISVRDVKEMVSVLAGSTQRVD
jgi:copper homeostasis protein